MIASPRLIVGSILAAALFVPIPGHAGGICPPPPDPVGCTLDIDRSTLTELDGDLDGQPDNVGSTGSFCAGDAPADCTGQPGSEVAFELIVSDPSRQSVTCSTQGVDIWIMSSDCGQCLVVGTGSVTLPAGTTTQSNLRVVVSDFNSEICPCGGSVTCTYSVEVECTDGADGDGDGLIDAADPDCCLDNDGDGFCGAADCDDANPIVFRPAEPMAQLHVGSRSTMTELSWAVPVSDWVDVASGSLSDLRGDGDFSMAACLIEDEANSSAFDTRPDPLPGDGYYYLARGQNVCGDGTYGLRPIVPRDDLDALAPCGYDPACPGCTFCDLRDPAPICDGEQCQATFGFPPTYCSGPTGSGGQGASCDTANDCQAGFACVEVMGLLRCRQWCRVSAIDCGFGSCAGFSPPLIIDGTEYGVCFDF